MIERTDRRELEKEKTPWSYDSRNLAVTAAQYSTRVPEAQMKCKHHTFVLHGRSSCDRYMRHNQQQDAQNSGFKNGKKINSNDVISGFASQSISFCKISRNVENSQKKKKYNRKKYRTGNFSV